MAENETTTELRAWAVRLGRETTTDYGPECIDLLAGSGDEMTVGSIRRALEGLPDDVPVTSTYSTVWGLLLSIDETGRLVACFGAD